VETRGTQLATLGDHGLKGACPHVPYIKSQTQTQIKRAAELSPTNLRS